MSSTDILFINLPIQRYYQKDSNILNGFNPSLGLLSIIGYLELNGILCSIMDLAFENIKREEFEKRLILESPVIVGITTYTENIDMAVKFAERIKRLLPECRVTFGGPHVSLSLEEFKESEYVDFAIQGEGESTFLELYQAVVTGQSLFSYDKIDGLAYRIGEEVIINRKRDFITDLDLLPIVKRGVYADELYRKNDTINLYTSKGCPGQCIYCAASALSGACYRVRNIGHVFLEILQCQHDYDVENYFMVDDSFTVIKDRLLYFMSLYRENNAGFKWFCESIANAMTEEMLDQMAENGCIAIQYGMESANQEIQKKIHKNVDLKHAMDIIKATYEKGINPCASFIFGHYCDTEETMRETVEMIKYLYETYEMEIGAGYNTPFPGTYQYIHKDELGIKIAVSDYKNYSLLEPVMETENFTLDTQRNYMYEIKNYIYQKGKDLYANKRDKK